MSARTLGPARGGVHVRVAATVEDDERIRGERKDKKVKAILHTGYPVRHWDHDLGPDVPHLLAGKTDVDGEISLDDLTPTPASRCARPTTTWLPTARSS